MNKYTPIIGLEVHVELKTQSKMFCACSADYFGKTPNTHTCPVCLGLPGALPVPNRQAIEWCQMIALALNCEINEFSKFDRKNYFYPDLPKGYQISQYDLPFGKNGSMLLSTGKTIGITRVHMEEDTGKLTHAKVNDQQVSLIDFNRSSVPLVEIVTEPDFNSAEEVKEYLQRLQQIVRYLDVSNADMEKGDMRLEPNISLYRHSGVAATTIESSDERDAIASSKILVRGLQHDKLKLPNYKVEVKNINSFRFVEKAIHYETKRQEEILERGERPPQETRGWNEDKGITFSQRSKEEAQDYRYFPEPDIPPILTSAHEISTLKSKLPELPDKKCVRFINDYAITPYDAEILTRENALAHYFEEAVSVGQKHSITPKQIANTIINKKIDTNRVLPAQLIEQIKESTAVAPIDEEKLQATMTKVLSDNEKAVADYKSGKETVIMFLVGQIMKQSTQKLDARLVKEALEAKLKAK